MIKSMEYRTLTDEEAIWQYVRNNRYAVKQILDLKKGDTFNVEYTFSFTVDPEVAKRIAKEYVNATL